MEEASSTSNPCLVNDTTLNPEDCEETPVEEWLEEDVGGFRVWQLAAIILSVLLAITIAFCCCIRFRIPRTKQEIEADYVRKKITKNFRKELKKISDSDMDQMNLKKALELVQEAYEMEDNLRKENVEKQQSEGLRTGLNAMLRGMRMRLGKVHADDMNI